jgi:glycosyltransferase involved in cell wall biosynthesis
MLTSTNKPLSYILKEAREYSALGDNEKAIHSLEHALTKESSLTLSEQARVQRALQLLRKPRLFHQEIPSASSKAEPESQKRDTIAWPKISIVTPTYNQGPFIEDTILSILNQNYPNLEYIIMDGGSTDNTRETIERYLERITVFVSEKDKGQSNAINKGMALTTGEILYWLNSDDILEPNTLMYVGLRYLEDHFDLLTGACTPFDHDSGQLLNRHIATCPFGLRTEDITDIEATWLKGMYFHQPEVFFSRRIWEAAGGYVDEDLYFSMDYDLWVRMAMASGHKAQVLTAGKSFCLFRQHSNQKTNTTEAYLPELLSHSKGLRERHLGKAFKGGFSTAKNYRQKLSIATISDFGFHGGAGIAHKRICQVLQAAGHEVMQLSGFQQWQSETLELDVENFKEALDILQPDLVLLGNLHNLKRGMEIAEYSSRHFPTLALAHDFWWITGRCAYTHGCHFLFTQCSQVCPTPSEYPRLDPSIIHVQHQRKKHLLQNPNFYVLANSSHTQTMFRKALEAWGLKSNPVGVVPLPIVSEGDNQLILPEGLCGPSTRADSAQVRIVLGCTDHADFRKGADLAALALHWLMARYPEIHLDVYGKNTDLILESLPEYSNRILLHGYLTSKEQYQDVLASGDIFLGTSREETLGQTFVEAAVAGLVTVGPTLTGYRDIVNACRYSIGYSSNDVPEIVRCVEQAIEMLRSQDRASIRLMQQCQAQASFSGVSFLSTFNHYLYSTGLWKRLAYHAPTKIHDLHYREQEIDEIVLCGSHVASEAIQQEGEAIETNLPISSWKLGPGLYLEDVEGMPVAWLKRTSTFLIAAENAAGSRSVEIGCHWIPDAMRETSCVLRICGFGSITALIPVEGNAILFDLANLQQQGHVVPAKLLCSLVFEQAIQLDDNRSDLALVCNKITFR